MINALQADYGIPGLVSIVSGVNGLPKVVITHASGSSMEIYLHGAHITSWKDAAGHELFFLSRESWFAPGKPIRGGIPVIFPQFGGGVLPSHGFARTGDWRLLKTSVSDSGRVVVEMSLTESPETMAMWPHKFSLKLKALLDEQTLTVSYHVANTGDSDFDFQAVLHTYFYVADISQTAIHGLKGTTLIDSLRDRVREVEDREVIRFSGETDRIYVNAPDRVQLDDEGDRRTITITKTGMPDVVVWNPWISKSQKMPDFGDDEYERMVCIETGLIDNPLCLDPKGEWQGETTFSASSIQS